MNENVLESVRLFSGSYDSVLYTVFGTLFQLENDDIPEIQEVETGTYSLNITLVNMPSRSGGSELPILPFGSSSRFLNPGGFFNVNEIKGWPYKATAMRLPKLCRLNEAVTIRLPEY